MNDSDLVAVLSRSFSANEALMSELNARYSRVRKNDTGTTLAGGELAEFLQGCSKAIVALETIDAELLAKLPDLRVIGKYGVGLNNVDLEACAKHDVAVGWTGGVNRQSVSELTIALTIAALRHVVHSHTEIREGTFRQIKGRQLQGKTVGIVGCGHVGKTVAKLYRAFDCEVLAFDRLDFPDFYRQNDVTAVDLDTLLGAADVVTLHLPFSRSTRNILSADRISSMKRGAVLINTARGGLVDEAALKRALMEGHLQAAALDVFSPEPPEDRELIRLPNFIATGHIGGSAEEAIFEMGMAAIRGLDEAVNALEHQQDD